MEFDPLSDDDSITDVVDAEVTKTEIMFDDESFRVNPNAIGRD